MIISDIEIQLVPGPIGVFCSGGADSAILLYILMKYSQDHITVFTLGNREKNYLNITTAENVIKKCSELTGHYNVSHVTRKAEKQTKQEIFNSQFIDYVDTQLVNVIYTGFTANPPVEVTDQFLDKTELTIRDPAVTRDLWHRENTFYTPFANIDKSKIAQIFQDLSVIDTLYPVTRSCEWHPDINTPDPGSDHCGKCWWCEERLWAFDKLS